MPKTSEQPLTAMKREVRAYLKRNGFDYDMGFYSKSAWRARGEPFGNEAAWSMTFEGPLYEALNYGEWGGFREGGAVDFLAETARKYGYFFEQGYAWSGHFYPDS